MHNLHVQFWLGGIPQLTLALAIVALVFGWMLSIHLRLLVFIRDKQHKERMKTGKDHKMRWCSSARLLRTALAFIMIPSLVAVVLGCKTVLAGYRVNTALMKHCGDAGTSHQLQETQQKLQAYYTACRKTDAAMRAKPVNQCPGFDTAFPPPVPFVRYIEAMERDLECTGICKFTAQPLFSVASDLNSRPQIRQRCAAQLAELVQYSSLLAGIPCIIVGGVVCLIAFALFCFDEL